MTQRNEATPNSSQRDRWRMILGSGPDSPLGMNDDPQAQAQLEALTFLYGREYDSRNVRREELGQLRQRSGQGQSLQSDRDRSPSPPDKPPTDPQPQPAPQPDEQAQPGEQARSGGQAGQPEEGSSQTPANNLSEESPPGETAGQDDEELGTTPTSATDRQQPAKQSSNAQASAETQSPTQDQVTQTSTDSSQAAPIPPSPSSVGPSSVGQKTSATSAGQDTGSSARPGATSSGSPSSADGDASGDGLLPPQTRQGGLGGSQLTVPGWINRIHELFPKTTIERLEKDALERYHLEELVTNPELLRRVEPSQTLLKAVLRTKHLMNPEVLALARQLIQAVIAELMEALAQEIQSPFSGALNRQQRSFLKIAKNFDPDTTIRQNLSTYDPETQKLYIKTPYFFSRIRRQLDRWQLIILVDESGSMLDSVIHAAVTASIFYRLQSIRTHLCIFDTQVVDLTEQCSDPVETLMQVQLGGGTDINQALTYANSLVNNPRNAIIILISDFFEGGSVKQLYRTVSNIVESGVTLLGLAALDAEANPSYSREIAQELVNRGASVGAMTPGELADWVVQKVGA